LVHVNHSLAVRRTARRVLTRRLRRPVPYWAVAAVLALVSALVVGRLVADASSARDRWGRVVQAVVVVDDVAAGTALSAGDVEVRSLPAGAVPAGALQTLPDGAVATVDMVAGEALVPSRLAPTGTSAVAARLPDGTRGVAVPVDGTPPLALGDRVDVVATMGDGSSGRPTVTAARDAVVVDVGEEAVTVAVAVGDVNEVAFALTAGVVTLALSGAR
jgi:Flp pilus assembly protein CpaB